MKLYNLLKIRVPKCRIIKYVPKSVMALYLLDNLISYFFLNNKQSLIKVVATAIWRPVKNIKRPLMPKMGRIVKAGRSCSGEYPVLNEWMCFSIYKQMKYKRPDDKKTFPLIEFMSTMICTKCMKFTIIFITKLFWRQLKFFPWAGLEFKTPSP